MNNVSSKLKSITARSIESLQSEGMVVFTSRALKKVYFKTRPSRKRMPMRDILFINGCTLPHPTRYRVDHQIEQLRASGLTADSVFYDKLHPGMLKYYRGFIFFRCPITPTVKQCIELAKQDNKRCYFDIDDLVVDTKYTDTIEHVRSLSKEEKAHYDDGVQRMKETLSLCDYAITTTETLRNELQKYVKNVFINRNVVSDEMVCKSKAALLSKSNTSDIFTIGYFSGSITHNEDFAMILPGLGKLMAKHQNVHLHLAGLLDLPKELERFSDRVKKIEFMDWRLMPVEMAKCDINLAPLTESIFNSAKSENKWAEAALVKVVTVASDIGAFKQVIRNGENGVLVDKNGWYDALDELVMNPIKRSAISEAAYREAIERRTTLHSGQGLADFISSTLARNIAFILPTTDISGGVNVILKHAEILRSAGWDVTLIDSITERALQRSLKQYQYRLEIPGFNVLTECRVKMDSYFDTMVATLWSTLDTVKKYPQVKNRLYLVQNFETDFYEDGATTVRQLANATYNDNTGVRYITISLWCQQWLQDVFHKSSHYAVNGLDMANYPYRERDFTGKVKVLVEGDSQSEYKNTDEAFRIINELDPNKYEVSYLSYRKQPKDWYRVDHFYNRIPFDKVGEVYASCDILIKTSILESFSYPPLEMMATGGLNVVLPNGGNVEYLQDGVNCLFYERGDIQGAAKMVTLLSEDTNLRNRLIKGGLKTAKEHDWKRIERTIVELYNTPN